MFPELKVERQSPLISLIGEKINLDQILLKDIFYNEKKIPKIFPTFFRFLLSNNSEGGEGLRQITEKELISAIYENKAYFTRMARRFLHSNDDVEDVLQETIYRAFKSIDSLNELAYLKTWLTRILINQCINLLRKSPLMAVTTAIETGASDANYNKTEIRQLVDMLEPDLRAVAILYYFEDLPQKDIAGMLNIPVGTVKSRLYDARFHLRVMLGEGEWAE